MVVVLRRERESGTKRRRLRLFAIPVVAVLVFAAGAVAQRQGWLAGAIEALGHLRATLTHPGATLDAALHGESLPELKLDVKWRDMQFIAAKREEALERGLLLSSGADFVPASLRAGGPPMRAKIRLKGDILDHVVTSKWSFRVHLRGDARYGGMRRFSIQHPKTRFYLHEWGFLETMRAEEILAPRYSFAEVRLNGDAKGIYAVEEAFAKELIESQRRREGLLLRMDEDPFHRWFHDLPPAGPDGIDVNPVSDRNVAVQPFDEGRVQADAGLAAQWARARTLLEAWFRRGNVEASEVFDAAVLGRYLAVCELWGAIHPLRWGNVRFYYNPITDRIEPVAYDGNIPSVGGSGPARLLALAPVREGLPGEPWTRRALRDPAVAEAYLGALGRMLSPDYLAGLEERLGGRWRSLATTLAGEFPGEAGLVEPWDRLTHRAEKLSRALRPGRHVLAYVLPSDPGGPARLEVAGILSVPVRVTGVEVDGKSTEIDRWLPACLPDEAPRFVSIDLPAIRVGDVFVRTHVVGFPDTVRRTEAEVQTPSVTKGVPPTPSVDLCLHAYPFLSRIEGERSLLVKPGDWDVGGDLLLPSGYALVATGGTTLRFPEGALLLARGPLRFAGTPADGPVVLTAKDGRWAGVAVLDAKAVSVWKHVRIERTAGIARDGWVLTSGVTFHRSPVRFRECVFRDHEGLDDQLNVFRSRLEIVACEFGGCGGDALDGDFVEGVIADCSFHDVGGDAMDFSGTRNLVIRDTRLARIGDKAVSAGEASHLRVERIRVDGASIAIASKDRSVVAIVDSDILRTRFALAAYRKKPEYGPGVIEASDLRLDEVENRTIIQSGSWVLLDGERIVGTKLDVKRLYEEGILGK